MGIPETSWGKEKANDVCYHYMSLYGSQQASRTKLHYRIGKKGDKEKQLIVEFYCLPKQIAYQFIVITPTKTHATWNPKPIVQFTQELVTGALTLVTCISPYALQAEELLYHIA